jgi:Transglycosylase SLT domain
MLPAARIAGFAWSQRRGLAWLVAMILLVLVVPIGVVFMVVGGGLASAGSGPSSAPSQFALGHIPLDMLRLYQEAAAKYGLEWEYLAAIGQVETHHGTLAGACATSSAGARGPMQFMPGTWDAYGNGGDVCDPKDAIPAAARYLKASGAPKDWDRALFAYNHAGWYVDLVKSWAEKYRGPLLGGLPSLPAGAGSHSQSLTGRKWLAPVPGTNAECDRRIVRDVVYLLRKYRMALGDCFDMTGHAINGEHPLGLAIDVVPARGGSWDLLDKAARDLGWRASCAQSGCRDALPAPMVFIGWNGFPGHGAGDHLHVSWGSSGASPGTPAKTVKTLLPAN